MFQIFFVPKYFWVLEALIFGTLLPEHPVEFEFSSKIHYVKITFDTPKFEKITKDRAAKLVDMFSAIGGTMGLLTGFSIISGVEIIFFLVKIFVNCLKKTFKKR